MKAITIKQPWASLICTPREDNLLLGIKDIENRTWATKFRGRVLIHSAAKSWGWDKFLNYAIHLGLLKPYTSKWTRKWLESLDKGTIIGSVEIVDCVINHPSIWAEKTKEVTLNIGDIVLYKNTRCNIKNAEITSFKDVGNSKVWFNGIDTQTKAKVWYPTHISLELMGAKTIYNWVLANPIKFPEPIPAKGKLSFWEYPNILSEPEEKDGKLFCHCQLPVKEINQVRPLGGGVFQCRYCGGYWYK